MQLALDLALMSNTLPINQLSDITAPTPQNTPLTHAPISAGLSRPTVPDISEDAEPAEEATTVHDAMFGLVQGRLAGLLGKSSGYIESLPDGTKKTIEALKGVQVKQNDLQNQYKRECLELEKKACYAFSVPFPSFASPSRPYLYHPIVIAGGGVFGPCYVPFVAQGGVLASAFWLPTSHISRLRSEIRNDRRE